MKFDIGTSFLAAALSALILPLHGDLQSKFSATVSDGGAKVEIGQIAFEIPAGKRLRLTENGKSDFLLSHNIRIAGQDAMAAAYEDHRDDRIRLVEKTAERAVVRTDRSLGLHDYKRTGAKTPWDAARLVTDHIFRRDVPGVIIVARLVAAKPFGFVSWHSVSSVAYSQFSIDGAPLKAYPVRKEFNLLPDGYRTRATAYIVGTSPDGRSWYLGREFTNFSPDRDGRPGSFYTRCDALPSSPGRPVSAGEAITLCAAMGRVNTPGDLELLRALRSGDGSLPAVERHAGWTHIPPAATRDNLKDYRPVASLGWSGPEDLSFTLRLAQDESGLSALVDVTDQKVVNTFTGKDIGLGDSIHAAFADAKGERTLERVYSAKNARRTPSGYSLEFSIGWDELNAAGIDRANGMRFNVCIADQDGGTDLENWMGVSDGILGGKDPKKFPFIDFAGVTTTFKPEREAIPETDELKRKIAEVKRLNDGLENRCNDEYTAALKAMTEYFVDFMQSDLNTEKGDTVAMSMMKKPRPVDDDYRHYMLERINKNADELLVMQRELRQRQADLSSGRAKPVRTLKHDFAKRPSIEDGGFKVNGRELLLLGPDTWTNSKAWRNRDIDYIARTGFNQMNVFYVGGTNRDEIARLARKAGLYCIWGSCASYVDVTQPTNKWPEIARRRLDPKVNIGCLNAPVDQGPNFVFQVSFPEQWDRRLEKTAQWATGFQTHLKSKFGSLEKLNESLGADYPSWTNLDFAAALGDSALKYESFLYRMRSNMQREIPQQQWKLKRYSMPNSPHFSSHYNMAGLDPLVALTDFEELWSMFDVTGFDGGFGLEGGEWAIDFAKGGFDIDFSRSVYPMKPVANNETHVIADGSYLEYPPKMTYLSNMLAFLLGLNSSSVWNWANSRHTYGEYVFTRACTYREMIRCSLDLRCHAEEIAAFRRAPAPPFRILHSLPSMAERDAYVSSLYGLYASLSFTGWPIRFLTERDLGRGDFKGAEIVVVPDARRVSDETFEALARFRRQGGIVIADGKNALTKDQWGKPIAERKDEIARMRRFGDVSSRTRSETLNAALEEKGCRAPVQVKDRDGKPPFGVIWRNARTAEGHEVVFLANLSRRTIEVALPGDWTDVLGDGSPLPRRIVLDSMDIVLGKKP